MQVVPSDVLASLFAKGDDPRSRLVAAMAEALSQHGYAAISVAQVVRLARVSKRTFYEHFENREQCYLAAYEAMTTAMLARIAEVAAVRSLPFAGRLEAAAHAYLHTLQELPSLTRTFFTEIQLAGPTALVARRHAHRRFAELLEGLVEEGRREQLPLAALTPELAIALVGAINELLLVRIEQDRIGELTELTSIVMQLVSALTLVQP